MPFPNVYGVLRLATQAGALLVAVISTGTGTIGRGASVFSRGSEVADIASVRPTGRSGRDASVPRPTPYLQHQLQVEEICIDY